MVIPIRLAMRLREAADGCPGVAWIACLVLTSTLVGTHAFAAADPAATIESDRPVQVSADDRMSARYDPATRETRIDGMLAQDLCVALRLPQEWRLSRDDHAIHLEAIASGTGLEIDIRSEAELRDFPQAGMAGRDAAALQRDYEAMIGKPAQAVVHEPTRFLGVSRWSATWIDANFANASHSLSVETFIVESPARWTLELTLSNAGTRDAYDAHVARILSSLRVLTGADCRNRPATEP